MMIIYFIDGSHVICDSLLTMHKNSYTIGKSSGCSSLSFLMDSLSTIIIDNVYYPTSSILKFRMLTEGEILSINRDEKLGELGI